MNKPKYSVHAIILTVCASLTTSCMAKQPAQVTKTADPLLTEKFYVQGLELLKQKPPRLRESAQLFSAINRLSSIHPYSVTKLEFFFMIN